LIGLLVLPVVLFTLPADYFDTGEALCPSKRFLDIECLGCGLTRGIQHAIHFQFEDAWMFNKLTFIVLPVAFFYWLYLVFIYAFQIDLWARLKEFVKNR
jgi:hypothetical protein